MARYAGKFAATKTGRRLQAVELAASDPDHAVAPKTVAEIIGLGLPNKLLLFAMIGGLGLDYEPLIEIGIAGPEFSAVTIKINLVRHILKRPYAVALTASEA